MDGWKKAVVAGSIGAATVLFLKKKYPAGVLATGVGLAVLASEYPEKFEKVRRSLPDYFDRGMHVMEMAARAGSGSRRRRGRARWMRGKKFVVADLRPWTSDFRTRLRHVSACEV